MDGLTNQFFRLGQQQDINQKHYFITFDGPIDFQWIENLNTVLDETRCLSLGNGERIRIHKNIQLVFESDNFKNASPATISRIGITYVDDEDFQIQDILDIYLKKF